MKKPVLLLLSLFFTASAGAAEMSLQDLGGDPVRAPLAAALQNGLKAYNSLQDYKATFQKQERSGAVLGPQETIFMKFEKPFKIYMAWMNTHKKGLQVLYERGKHDGKLVIHQPGLLLGLAPVIFLDQDSPYVREGSESYNIEDAGIGSFLADFSKAVLKGAGENKLKVISSQDASGEAMDVTFDGSKEGEGFFAYRVVVHFDGKTLLPDRMQLFDWQNAPMGVYAYENIKLNVGAEDEEFKKLAQRKIYRLYQPVAERKIVSNNFSGKSPRATPTAG